ncbi:hypothetical protein GCM10022419_040100 [Nonomuraea rosea]|uniref:Uncharacterized protein n=1 Tax=Nonomuraea rosea TaxID=638574 RepID=A0ABP6WTH1_9ACTN
MAGSGRGRPVGLVLLALGPVLVAAYAAVNRVAIQLAAAAQVKGPEWGGRRVGSDGLTSLGVDTWRAVWWSAAFLGAVAVAFVVIGAHLRRSSRGRTPLLVLSGVLIVPYAVVILLAYLNPVRLLGEFYDAPDFSDGIPSWQGAAFLLLIAAGLAQAVGFSITAGEGKRRPPPAEARTRAPAGERPGEQEQAGEAASDASEAR